MWVDVFLCVNVAFIDCGGIEGEPQVCVECGDVVFNISKDTEKIAERGRRFPLVWFVCFWCPQRDFADCVRMAPPADNWPEIAVEL